MVPYFAFFTLKSTDDTLWVKFWDSFFGKEDTSTIRNRIQPDATATQHECLRTQFLKEYSRFWKLSVLWNHNLIMDLEFWKELQTN